MVAVLIANVTFIGYVTPPGGTHPYWETCFYRNSVIFTAFNGAAFLLSLLTVFVVTFLPVGFRPDDFKAMERVKYAGLSFLALAISCFILAFGYAGLVSAALGAPDVTCGLMKCEEGGVLCEPTSGFLSRLLEANYVKGRCFTIDGLRNDSTIYLKSLNNLSSITLMSLFSLSFCRQNDGKVIASNFLHRALASNPPLNASGLQSLVLSAIPSLEALVRTGNISLPGCYFKVREIFATNSTILSQDTRNVLCFQQGGGDSFESSLSKVSASLHAAADDEAGLYYLPIFGSKQCRIAEKPDYSFATYVDPSGDGSSAVFFASESSCYGVNTSKPINVIAGNYSLCEPIFSSKDVGVYDDLKYRCFQHAGAGVATICAFDKNAVGSSRNGLANLFVDEFQAKRYNGLQRRCQTGSCGGYAVSLEGNTVKNVPKANMYEYGNSVWTDASNFGSSNPTERQDETVIIVVMALGLPGVVIFFIVSCIGVICNKRTERAPDGQETNQNGILDDPKPVCPPPAVPPLGAAAG